MSALKAVQPEGQKPEAAPAPSLTITLGGTKVNKQSLTFAQPDYGNEVGQIYVSKSALARMLPGVPLDALADSPALAALQFRLTLELIRPEDPDYRS